MTARTDPRLIASIACLLCLLAWLPGAAQTSAQRTPTTGLTGEQGTAAPAVEEEEEPVAGEVPPEGEVPLEEAPTEPVEEPPPPTAAERFAALPRFGAAVFGQLEYPEKEEPEPEAGEQDDQQLQQAQARPRVVRQAGVVTEAVPPTYIIGPGDELLVRVWTDAIEHIKASPTVDADGRVYLELLGEVTVAGESIAEVRQAITRRYRVFFTRAEISVGLARTRVIEVRVTGDAMYPGKYLLSGDATLFSALYAAGGPSEIGSLRTIRLARRGQEPRVIDLYQYLLYGDVSADVALLAEDTIFIPPAGATIGVDGEVRRPARYEVLGQDTTLTQALEMAAGVRATGYAHNLELWRVGESGRRELINLDVATSGEMTVRDGDLIVLTPVLEEPENIVELAGAVMRPGVYEVRPGMTVSDLITLAQGLSDDAHTEQAELWRLGPDLDYELTPFDLAAALAGDPTSDLVLQPRDRIEVLSEQEVERAMEVEATGAVARPGVVPWVRGMRVSDLVLRVGGLAEGAYTPQANLLRIGPNQRRQVIAVDLDAALAGDPDADVVIERGDVLEVLLREMVCAPSEVNVAGEVNLPGYYPRLQGMRVSDAILAAGGLSRTAGDQVEYTAAGVVGRVQPLYLMLRREGEHFVVEPDPIINDNDLISVLGTGELISEPPQVAIAGRVRHPATYALQETAGDPDTVYELIERAGGLLPDANPRGMVLYRLREEIISDRQGADLHQLIATFNRELVSATVEGQEQVAAGVAGQVAESLQAALSEGGTTVVIPPRRLSERAWVRAVPIDGQAVIESEGREGDFPLTNGDVLVVPTTPTTATVMGAVVRAGALPWKPDQRAIDYIQQAGGLTTDARQEQTVVVRANGEVVAHAMKAPVYAGDVILVPSDYIFREVNPPDTFDRIMSAITGILTGYLIFK